MNTLWLKKIDTLSKAVPPGMLRFGARYAAAYPLCALRPGGLGDLVALTRACLESGLNPRSVFWICEARNAPWAEYLNIPYERYDSFRGFGALVTGRVQHRCVINSEQYHGLASLMAHRLAGRRGRTIAFSSNPLAASHTTVIPYNPATDHQLEGFKALFTEALKQPDVLALKERNMIESSVPLRSPAAHAVIALGGLTCSYRALPLSAWVALAEIAFRYANEVYLLGAPSEQQFANALAERSPALKNMTGRVSFTDTVNLIKDSSRFVGIDSGLLHIADFFGVPSTAVFTEAKKKQWAPLTKGSELLDAAAFR